DHDEKVSSGALEAEPLKIEIELESQATYADQAQHHRSPDIAFKLKKNIGCPVSPCQRCRHHRICSRSGRATRELESIQCKVIYGFSKYSGQDAHSVDGNREGASHQSRAKECNEQKRPHYLRDTPRNHGCQTGKHQLTGSPGS